MRRSKDIYNFLKNTMVENRFFMIPHGKLNLLRKIPMDFKIIPRLERRGNREKCPLMISCKDARINNGL